MTNHIVVGYDGTPSSNAAVGWAAGEAAVRNVDLLIVSCCEFPAVGAAGAGWMGGDVISPIIEVTQGKVAAMKRATMDLHPGLRVHVEVTTGGVHDSLGSSLAPDDLLVVGSSRHEGAAGFWLGSTSRWATRHSPCPVVVVRGGASSGRPDRIVVGIDGSAAADAALLWAADEADRHGVDLVVVHGYAYAYAGLDTHSEQVHDLIRIDAACVLDRAVELARDRCMATVKDLLIEDTPVNAILDSVRDGDVLVLGASGSGAVASRLIGSTVNSVVDQAAVPVVVVRPAG